MTAPLPTVSREEPLQRADLERLIPVGPQHLLDCDLDDADL